jgi:hypothetical protein
MFGSWWHSSGSEENGVTSYEIGVLGDFTPEEAVRLTATLTSLLADFDLIVGNSVMVRTSGDFRTRNTHAATVATYFGGAAKADQDLAREAVIPVFPSFRPSRSLEISACLCPSSFSPPMAYVVALMTRRCSNSQPPFWNVSDC